MSTLKEKSIKGLFWDFTGRIGLQGIGFVVSIFLARLLAPEEFGIIAIITVFINLANVFVDYGFNIALIQKQDIDEKHFTAVFYLNVLMGFALSSIVFLLAPLIGQFYEKDILTNITRLMSIGIFISSFGHIMRSRLQRNLNFKLVSVANICAAIVSGVLAMVLAFKGFGVWSLAIQSVINQLLSNVLLYFFSKPHLSLTVKLNVLQELWPFSSRVFFSGLLDTLFYNFDSLIIGKLLNPSTLGFYQRAKSLENFGFRYTASTVASVLLPGLSTLQNDPATLRQSVLKIFHLLSFISFLGCGIFLVGGNEIIIILFSAKWEPSVIMFQILISGAFASQGISFFNSILLSIGQSKKYLQINAANKILLFLNFGLLFVYGLKIYLIGFVLVQFIVYYLSMYKTSNQIRLKSNLVFMSVRYLIIYFLSSLISMLVKSKIATFSLTFDLIFSIILFSALFCGLSKLFNSEGFEISKIEFLNLLKQVVKLPVLKKS